MSSTIDRFNNLSAQRKLSLLTLFIASVFVLILLFSWARAQDFRVLYTGLSDVEAAGIIEELKGTDIQYRVASGALISVEAERLYETRLWLKGRGFRQRGLVGRGLNQKSGAKWIEGNIPGFSDINGEELKFDMNAQELEYRRRVERGYEARIEEILAPLVGEGKVIASVSAQIDFKHVQRTMESFDPDNVVVRSEELNIEKKVPSGGAQGRLLPQVRNESYNYEINKITSTTIEPTARLSRLSVAVLVDGSYTATIGAVGATQGEGYIERTEEEIAQYKSLVEQAAGLLTSRGDTLEVVSIPFDPQGDTLNGAPTIFGRFIGDGVYRSSLRYATILILALLTIVFILRPLIKGLFTTEPGFAPDGEGAFFATAEPVEIKSITEVREKMRDIVEDNPRAAAHIIKGWLRGKGDANR